MISPPRDQLLATRDGWQKAGMLAKLEQCGTDRRPCIRVDESAGQLEAGGHSDYRVISGY